MRKTPRAVALLVLTLACGNEVVDPCTSSKPILQISAAQGTPTGTRIPILMISNVRLNGQPMDTADLRQRSFNLQRLSGIWFDCTVPCSLGYQPGTYAFDAYARDYYGASFQAVADYSNTPPGCPASHGTPAQTSVALIEADSSRVSFQFSIPAGLTLGVDSVQVSFDDGSGQRTFDLTWPWPTFQIRNYGTLHVRYVIGVRDTIAVGQVDVPLRKDRQIFIGSHLANRNPMSNNTCAKVLFFEAARCRCGFPFPQLGICAHLMVDRLLGSRLACLTVDCWGPALGPSDDRPCSVALCAVN